MRQKKEAIVTTSLPIDGTARMSRDEAHGYWERLHASGHDALATVCFPDKSRLINAFFDRFQKYSVRRAIRATIGDATGRSVLDVGSGRGRWIHFYRGLGAKPVGVDIAPVAVADARAQGLDVRQGAAEHLSFEDGSFDVVSEVTVLLHLVPDAQQAAISEFERVCRFGGYIVMLDITSPDPSPHVFPRRLDEWVAMFHGSTLVYAENHYFAWPLRALWRSRLMRLPAPVVRVLEDCAVLVSIPLEYAAMQLYRGKVGHRGLQHVMIFQRMGRGG